jgi:hypothetical protein
MTLLCRNGHLNLIEEAIQICGFVQHSELLFGIHLVPHQRSDGAREAFQGAIIGSHISEHGRRNGKDHSLRTQATEHKERGDVGAIARR